MTSGSGNGILETDLAKELNDRIANGEISLKINEAVQKRHYRGTKEYNEFLERGIEESYFNEPLPTLQSVLIDLHGTGQIFIDRDGVITEKIDTGKDDFAFDTRLRQGTSYVKAHYSKRRTHLSPFTPKNKNRKG